MPLRPENIFIYSTRAYFVDPACLIDCFPDGHCGKEVIKEYIAAGGACSGSSWYDHDNNNENDVECQYINATTVPSGDVTVPTVGIFSPDTLSMLKDPSCTLDIYRRSLTLVTTFQYLVYTSSDIETYVYWREFNGFTIFGLPEFLPFTSGVTSRLHPGTR